MPEQVPTEAEIEAAAAAQATKDAAQETEIEQAITAGQAAQAASATATGGVNALAGRVAVLEARPTTGAGSPAGKRALEEFQGTGNDDTAITNAMAFIAGLASDVAKPTITIGGKGVYGPCQVGRKPQDFFHLEGPDRITDQPKNTRAYACEVKVQGEGGWWKTAPNVTVVDFGLADFTVNGQLGHTSLLESSPGGDYRTCEFLSVGAANHKTIIGTPAAQLLITATTFDGWSNWNNCTDSLITLGGSDSKFFLGEVPLIDSPTSMMKGDWMVRLAYLSKSRVGSLYITAEGRVGGMLVTGNDSVYGTVIDMPTIEGRNQTADENGTAIMFDKGGEHLLLGGTVDNVMADPTNSALGVGGSLGAIVVKAGRPTIEAVCYARDDTVGEAVPFIYAAGGDTTVRSVRRGGPWTGLPVVAKAAGATVRYDDTVTVKAA